MFGDLVTAFYDPLKCQGEKVLKIDHQNRLKQLILLVQTVCFIGVWFATFVMTEPARAAEKPFLQLDTGGHMALIRKMIFTPDGKKLISASDDKTIRIWDVRTGRTTQILRGEITEGETGKIYSIALSPNGRVLAAAGDTEATKGSGHPIRLYDLKTGRIFGLLKGHSGAVLSLDFSKDGKYLASGGMDDTAILWDIKKRTRLLRLKGHVGDVNVVRFAAKGRHLVTGGDDKTVRLWRALDGRALAILKKHKDVVRDISVSPGGTMFVSGAVDGQIHLRRSDNGRLIKSFGDKRFEVTSLTFAPDGKSILSGSGSSPYHSFLWDLKSGKKSLVYKSHNNIVLATAISPKGKLLAMAGGNNNEIHLWNRQSGKLIKKLKGVGRAVWAVGFSPNGRNIAWGHVDQFKVPNDLSPLKFMLRLPRAGRTTGEPRRFIRSGRRFIRAVPRQKGFRLTHRSAGKFGYFDTIDVVKDKNVIAGLVRGEQDGYAHNTYSFLPDRNAIVTGGGHGFLSAYGINGRKAGEYIGHTGDVWAIAISRDGKRLISGSDDQTLRLWNVKTGENIMSLFHASNGAWVMWTPQGYFSASPNGDEHVGWHINAGPGKAARFVTAAQLKKHFYRPDIVKRALELNSAKAAIAEAPSTQFALQELLHRKPPSLQISSRAQSNDGLARINVRVLENIDPAERFELVVNGRNITAPRRSKTQNTSTRFGFTVPLQAGANQIKVTAINAVGKTERRVSLNHKGVGSAEQRGTLYMVSIGVDDYTHFSQDLNYAGADAKAFHDMMRDKAGKLHNEVKSVLLTRNSKLKPTAKNVRKALEIFQEAKPEDTVVLFLAGHGINDGADYLFLPSDAKHENKAWKKSSVINWQLLQGTLQKVQGRRIMVVDTCHAGNAFNARLVKDADDASIVVFAATDAETLAQEQRALGHGVFTYSVLKGLEGEADKITDRLVKTRELKDFIIKKVKAMTKGAQEPTVQLPNRQDFVLTHF